MKWVISLPFYGAFLFDGTEAQAEEMRAHKANWEREIARKRPATPAECAAGKVILQKGDAGFELQGKCFECRRPYAECRCGAPAPSAKERRS